MEATVVTTRTELFQIYELSRLNQRDILDAQEKSKEGFVSWLYSIDLLENMHQLAPSIIVKDHETLAGYALTTLPQAQAFHEDLKTMFGNLEKLQYRGRPLFSYRFYCMGQICVAKEYRGKNVVPMLYHEHRRIYGKDHDFILTEISTSNVRSIRAHEKIGFQTIYQYRDLMDEWAVVIWDWK